MFEGEPATLKSVVHARSLGIETVFQNLAMINDLPVYLNLHLNPRADPPPAAVPAAPCLDHRNVTFTARLSFVDLRQWP